MHVTQNKICVSVPIKNSRFQYKTNFNSYFNACEYIEMHLIIFEENDVKLHINDECECECK